MTITRSETLKKLPLSWVRTRAGYHWFVIVTVCIGAFMAALDASIMNIALPTFHREFHARMHTVEWISLAYLLTLAALIVVFGRIADMIGRRWMYTFGFLVFVAGSLSCGLAASLPYLIAFRVVQAVGAAMLQANSVAIITAATPAHQRGKAIGIQASAQGIGLSLGPAIGGALISFLNWRWIFLVNVPIGLIGTALAVLLLPRDEGKQKRERFDVLGAGVLTAALVALIYILNMGLKQGWTSPLIVGCYVVVVLGFSAFVMIERKSPSPLIDLALFKRRAFSLGNITGIASFAVMYAVMLLAPFYLDGVESRTAFSSGLFMTIIPIGMTLVTSISGVLADRFGTRIPTIAGMIVAMSGCISLAFLGNSTAHYTLPIGLFLVGAGIGLFTPPNNCSVMGSVPSTRLGVAGGVLNMSRSLGMGLGVTLGGLVYQLIISLQGVPSENLATNMQMLHAFHGSFMVISGLACVGLIISSLKHDDSTLPQT